MIKYSMDLVDYLTRNYAVAGALGVIRIFIYKKVRRCGVGGGKVSNMLVFDTREA